MSIHTRRIWSNGYETGASGITGAKSIDHVPQKTKLANTA
jgi:hypothetical protein